MPSLREQKKRATARALAASAYALAVERGFEAVTTDDITTAAGVSRRTFANYYSSKHAAVVDGFLQGLGIPLWRPADPIADTQMPTKFSAFIDSTQAFITDLLTDTEHIERIQTFTKMVHDNRSIEPFIHAVFLEFRHSDVHSLLAERFGQAKVGMFLGSVFGSLGGIVELILGPLAIRPDTPPLRGVKPTTDPITDSITDPSDPADPIIDPSLLPASALVPFDLTAALILLDQAFSYIRHGFVNPR